MKQVLLVFAMLCATVAFAQTQPAQPSTPVQPICGTLAVGTEYIHFDNGMTGTMVEGVKPITACTKKLVTSIGYAQIMIPNADTSFYLVGPRVDTTLSKLFPKISSELSNIGIFAGGGLGTAQVSPTGLPQQNHFAYGFHGGLNISPGSFLGMQAVFSIEAGLVGYNRTVFKASTLPQTSGQFAAGIQFVIGQSKPAPTTVTK